MSQSWCLVADRHGKGRPIGYIIEVQHKAGKYCSADSHAADELAFVVLHQEVRHIDADDSYETAASRLESSHHLVRYNRVTLADTMATFVKASNAMASSSLPSKTRR